MWAALIPAAAASAHMISTARSPVILRATPTTMTVATTNDQVAATGDAPTNNVVNVESWYDSGVRLNTNNVVAGNVESWYDNGVRINLPSGMSATVAVACPELALMAMQYEAELTTLQARLDGFPKGQRGTMVGIVKDQIAAKQRMLETTVEAARLAAPEPGQRREAYYCTDQGCWIAEQYFCNDSGCWIFDPEAPDSAELLKLKSKSGKEETMVQQGIFAPAVKLTAEIMGRKELNAFRASVIAQHTKVISSFVDTSESPFGRIAMKSLFEAADKDGNGTLDKEEVKEALFALGFKFVDDKQIKQIFKRADSDKNEVIDFEEFVKECPKTLRTNLVKLAKENGHDLGFLS